MPAITISPAWKAWRTTASEGDARLLRRLAGTAAEAAHDYRMKGNAQPGYTGKRNLLIVQALKRGIPVAIVAEAANMSTVKVQDVRRESRSVSVA